MKIIPLLLLLAACVPVGTSPQPLQDASTRGAFAPQDTPRPSAGPNKQMTAAAVDLQAQIVAATSQAGAIIATQGAATQVVDATIRAQAWQIVGYTATSEAQHVLATAGAATATEEARGTATAAWAPFGMSTYTALKEAGNRDAEAAAIASARAERRLALVPYTTAAPLVVVGVLCLCLFLLVRAFSVTWILKTRAQYALPRDEYENVYEPITAPPDTFITQDHQRMLRPVMPTGVTEEHIRRIAVWVVSHGYTWSDEMRSGQGVGLEHSLLKSYRDGYLLRVGALERVGQGFIVTELGKEYFARKANPLPQAEDYPQLASTAM